VELFRPAEVPPLALFDPKSDFFNDIMWVCLGIMGIIIAIVAIGLIYEAFRMCFFSENAVKIGERLGLAHNAGYTTDVDDLGKIFYYQKEKSKQLS